jgi:hypothetical protein
MAAINFPDSPSENDTFIAAGRTWLYDGATWVSVDTTPEIPEPTFTNHFLLMGA